MQPPARAPGGYIYFSRFFVTGLSLAWFMAGFSLRRLFAAADTFISYATTIFKFLILMAIPTSWWMAPIAQKLPRIF